MNETVKKYRYTMGRIGSVLLLFLLMFYGSALIVELLRSLFEFFMPRETVSIVISILSAVVYFASFTLAAWFYHLGEKENAAPVRFAPKLPKSSFLIIFAGVACTLSLAIVNSVAATAMGLAEPEEIFKLPNEFSKDSSIVLQFIALAVVPAFCEEILFRGVVLSNLMPYGKANAIVISALLFGLMHGDFYQFLYATAAGIIMGCVYVLTESIWCSILLHFINNTVSVLQFAVTDRFSEEYAWLIVLVYECLLIVVGLICAFALLSKRSEKGINEGLGRLTFSERISLRDSMKGFLIPTVLSFCILSVIFAFSRVG